MKLYGMELLHEKSEEYIKRARFILEEKTCANRPKLGFDCSACPFRLKEETPRISNLYSTKCGYMAKYDYGGAIPMFFEEICKEYLGLNINIVQEELEI